MPQNDTTDFPGYIFNASVFAFSIFMLCFSQYHLWHIIRNHSLFIIRYPNASAVSICWECANATIKYQLYQFLNRMMDILAFFTAPGDYLQNQNLLEISFQLKESTE
jgi:hypothetical protein